MRTLRIRRLRSTLAKLRVLTLSSLTLSLSLTLTLTLLTLTGPQAMATTGIQTVPKVDLARYAGRWYEISANPLPTQNTCVCNQQTLDAMGGQRSDILIYDSCNDSTVSGPLKDIRGRAINDDPDSNARFTVDFNLGVRANYWIIALEPTEYRWAVVSEPTGHAVYILSRTTAMTDEDYHAALKAAGKQVDTSKLKMTLQEGCTYPAP